MSYTVTQEDYDTILFLTRLSYYEDVDDIYPEPFNKTMTVEKFSGLRLNMFDMDDYILFIICGTNSLVDWIANCKVALGIVPHQYTQAYYYIKNNTPNSSKPIIIAGHSLGGGIAEYVASSINHYFQIVCITFNGCGCSHLIHPSLRDSNEVINVVTDSDILNGITMRLPFAKCYMQHCGTTYVVNDESRLPLSVKAHSDFKSMSKLKL